MYKRVSGGIPRFGRNKFDGNRSDTVRPSNAGQGGSKVKREMRLIIKG